MGRKSATPTIGTCAACGARMLEHSGDRLRPDYLWIPRHRTGIAGAVHYTVHLKRGEQCSGSLKMSLERVRAQKAVPSEPYRGVPIL